MTLVFFAHWADYEEDGYLIIAAENGIYYYQEGGYSMLMGDLNMGDWEEISQDDALRMMLEWEFNEDDSFDTLDEALYVARTHIAINREH